MRIPTILACCGLSAAASAADLTLRGGYERYGDDYTIDVGGSESDQHWDQTNGYFLGLQVGVPVVPLLRLGVYAVYRDRSDSDSGVDLDYTSWGGRGEASLSLGLVPKLLHLELTPFVGFDSAKLDYDAGPVSDSSTSTAIEYGAHVDLVATAPVVQAGIGAGWFWTTASFDHAVGPLDADIDESAWMARIFAGISF